MNGCYSITVKNVRKSYGDFIAVNDLSFEVQKSECFGLLGPNGAGKTTMMKMIYGVANRDPYSGSSISVFGYDPMNEELEIKNLCGVVPQEDNLDIELNVAENLSVFCRFYGMPKKAARDRIDYLLDLMELSDKRDAKIKTLSGGMKRRLIIARALINEPKLLILDEPTTGLDPQVRHLIWNKLRAMKKQDMTLLLTTHYMEEAFQLCDRLIIMDAGKKIMEGNPKNLIENNMEHFVLELRQPGSFGKIEGYLKEAAGRAATAVDSIRIDQAEDTVHVYSSNLEMLQEAVRLLRGDEHYLRQSNLEDLFLKATGRAMSNAQ